MLQPDLGPEDLLGWAGLRAVARITMEASIRGRL